MPLMDKRPDLTVITHARDAEEDLARLLPTVRWATEVVVLDMQSTDTTACVAREAGARVISIPLHPRVDAIRNRYLEESERVKAMRATLRTIRDATQTRP